MTDIIVPALGESVSEATIARWLKKAGDSVARDEAVVELETDKVTLEVNAPTAGILSEQKANEGDMVSVGDILGTIGEGSAAAAVAGGAPATPQSPPVESPAQKSAEIPTGVAITPQLNLNPPAPGQPSSAETSGGDLRLSPAAQKIASENNIDPTQVAASGPHNTITKGDLLSFAGNAAPAVGTEPAAPAPTPAPTSPPATPPASPPEPQQEVKSAQTAPTQGRSEERVRMTRLRAKIAERLMHSQKSTATLTTFNEIDMSNVIQLRQELKGDFEKKHGVKLGFMSFFVKAAVVALKEIPAVNGEIDGDEIVYKNFYDIGVAVGTPQGLVVPVVRDADVKSFAQIELDIADMATRAREGRLTMEEMIGGTFTVSNGGVYGSLMSTPILNPPQSGILGMHKTEKRAVVVDDKIEIRPMMYVALSYDHRIIDGTESVTFLKRIKECVENPERIMLEM